MSTLATPLKERAMSKEASEGSPRILVVDDDAFVREILEFVLQAADYLVETAESGAEALEKCLSGQGIDLIVSDLNMPGMSGLELTRELRKNNVDVPIIVLTGESEISAAEKVLASGANGCLVKDEDIQETILVALEKAVKEYRAKKGSG